MQKTHTLPMPPALKTLSPAELAKLEHAFANDPSSEAYKPLAEAYLGMGRFIEAMVVCKKGIKAHPSLAYPRVLLARVYADQGKDKRALEELTAAAQTWPTDKAVLRLMGSLQMKGGEVAAGTENLLKAFVADQADPATLELMEKNGVPVPARTAAAPPRPEVVAPPPVATAPVTEHPQATPSTQPQTQPKPQKTQAQAQAQFPVQHPEVAPQRHPEVQPRVQRRVVTEDSDRREISSASSASSVSGLNPVLLRKHKSNRRSEVLFFLLLVGTIGGGLSYWALGQHRARLIREANAAISEATKLVKSDTFKGYVEAISKSEFALDLNASSETTRNARGLLAYAYTIRWGEHIHDSSNRDEAEKHLKAGIAGKEQSAYLHAAESMFDFYNGKTAEGLKLIEERIKAAEANKKQVSIYYLTRGLLQMSTGDLEGAKESLDRAQAIAPDDPRVFIALGNLYRRRGNDTQALSAFNIALDRTRKTHPEGLLGTANLILDQENPDRGYCTAATYVKAVQEMADSASPRQLATNSFVRAFLISRVSRDIPQYKDTAFQRTLEECTQVKPDEAAARRDITQAEAAGLALDPNNPELRLIRGRRLAYAGKLDEAEAELREAIRMNQQASHFHMELAKVLMRKEGGDAAAEAALQSALSLVPNSPKLLSMLGQAQFRQKKMDAAQGTLEKAISDSRTRNPEARFFLGKIYRDHKRDVVKAIELLKKAGEEYITDPTMASVAFDELAIAFEQKGDKDSARATYEKALNADKENPAPYCHYARFLSKDPKERERTKAVAQGYLQLGQRDSCTEEMQRLSAGG